MSGPPAHPYLFFGAGDLGALRARAASVMKPQLHALLAFAAAHLDEAPPAELSGGYEERGDVIQDPFLARTLAFSLLAAITSDARYVVAAKRWALALAAMERWVGVLDPSRGTCANCGYPEGWGVTALSVAYDFLHALFTDGERALIRQKIAAVCSGLHHATFAGEWWTGAKLHHDTWIPIGGLGVGAMAVIDEVPEAARWAERAREALDEALDWLDADGAWPEGPCGWAFAMISAVPFWDAYRRRFPERAAALLGDPWLRRTSRFRLYSRVPDGRFLAFGDCHPHGGYQENAKQAAPTLRWLAARYRDAHAQWLAAREWETVPNPYTASWEILWMDPSVPESPPDTLPVGALFDNQEMAFVRTGWDASATALAFRCDSLLGRRAASLYRPGSEERFNNSTTHVHADANAFGVWARGDFALTMPRYGQNASEFSNTLLVDGHGQYRRFGPDHLGRPDGMVTAFFASPAASLVAGDATRCYPPGLERFVRRVILVDPGVVFVIDDVAARVAVDLEWRFHVDGDASLDLGADGFTSVARGRTTQLRIASPCGARLGQGADRYNRAVSIRSRQVETMLVAALAPSLDEAAVIDAPTDRSFVVRALGATVLAAFDRVPGYVEVPGLLSARASAATVTLAGGERSFFAAEATRVDANGARLLDASSPVTVSHARGHVVVQAEAPATIMIEGMTLRVPAGVTRQRMGRC